MIITENDSSRPRGKKQPELFSVPNVPKGIDLKTHKTIRIAVSGDVHLNKMEVEIVDTPEYQRLRRIKQLGATYLIYPTALHSRFDHSLGTHSMANTIVRAIRENKHNEPKEREIDEEAEQLIRLFALLHDICHIPFGHTFEDEFCVFPRHDKDNIRTERFLGRDSRIGAIIINYLGSGLYDRFMRIYGAKKDNLEELGSDLFIYDIVNNTVCADLLDYLKRDCYFCNVAMDMDYRFLNYLYLSEDKGVRQVVVRLWKPDHPRARRDTLTELIRLLDNRYLLGERVYFHHAKLIPGTMISAALHRALTAGKIKREEIYEMGDEELLLRLQSINVESVQKLAKNAVERKLWDQVYERSRKQVDEDGDQAMDKRAMEEIMNRWYRDPKSRTEDENRIASELGMKDADVLIHCPDSDMAMKLAEMKVVWKGKLQPLKDCKEDLLVARRLSVIQDSHQNLWEIRAFLNPTHKNKESEVFAACDYLFTFERTRKERCGRTHYGNVVDEVVRTGNLASNMAFEEIEKRKSNAVSRLLSQTGSHDFKKIITDAFKK